MPAIRLALLAHDKLQPDAVALCLRERAHTAVCRRRQAESGMCGAVADVVASGAGVLR